MSETLVLSRNGKKKISETPKNVQKQTLDKQMGTIELVNSLQNYPNAPGREALLNDHMMKWFKVRRRWKEAAAKNEERYKPSMDLLKEMFEK